MVFGLTNVKPFEHLVLCSLLIRTNLLLNYIRRQAHTEEYWPEVMAVRTELSKVHTKTPKGQFLSMALVKLVPVSNLLYMA